MNKSESLLRFHSSVMTGFAAVAVGATKAWLVGILLLAVWSAPTFAVTVSQDGVELQSETFEGDTAGTHPANWSPKDGRPPSANNMVLAGGVPGPAHLGGNQYLLLDRANNSNSDGRAYINSWTPFDTGTAAASMMLYFPSTNNAQEGQIGFGSNLSNGLAVMAGRKTRGVIEYYDGVANGWAAIETTYTNDVWQQWDFEFNLDTGMASICIDGECSSDLNTGRTGADVTISRLEIEAGWDGANPHSKLYIDDVGEGGPPPSNTDWVWGVDSGSWHTPGNWTPAGGPPRTNAQKATFGSSITTASTVLVDSAATVGTIELNNANRINIAGTAAVTLEAETGNASIDVQAGSHQFQVPVTLNSNTGVSVVAGESLDFDGPVDLNGNTLDISAALGTVNFYHSVQDTAGGGGINNAGTLGGSSSIGGDLNSDGTLLVQIAGSGHDSLEVGGVATLNGTLAVELAGDYTPSAGETYTVLSAGSLVDDGIALGGSAAGLFNLEVAGGSLVLTAIPEPSTIGLIGLAVALLAACGSRKVTRVALVGIVATFALTSFQPLEAVEITHSVSGLVFQDAFESPAEPESIFTDGGVGEWTGNGFGALDQSTNSTDFANVGSQSGKFIRGPGSGGRAEGWFDMSIPLLTSGTITAKFATYVNSENVSSNTPFQIGFGDTLAGRIQLLAKTSGEIVANDGINPSQEFGVPFVQDQWQNWMVNIDLDNETYEYNVDNASSGTLNLRNNIGSDSKDMWLMEVEAGVGDTFYMDTYLEPAESTDFSWKLGAGNDWNAETSWLPSTVPNANNHTATFAGKINADSTVYTNAAVTARQIVFDNSDNLYNIAGTGQVVLDNVDAGNAAIDVLAGTHQFQAMVSLLRDSDVTTAAAVEGESEAGVLSFDGPVALNGNTLNITAGSTVNINHAEVGAASGTVSNSGTLGGTDMNAINGDLTNNADGTLGINIGGTGQYDFDSFQVAGTADLAGSLSVELADGFTLSGNESFEVLTAGSLVNNGISLSGPNAADFTLDVNTATGVVTLSAGGGGGGLAGDFNNNGTVDAADFTVWRDSLGAQDESALMGNGDGSGVIDEGDYALWFANFGNSSGSGSGSSAVPEPAACLLLAFAGSLVGLGVPRYRR